MSTAAAAPARLTETTELTAGILYCLFTREFDQDRDQDYDWAGALAYWDGYDFIYEDGEECREYWEWAVAQSSTPAPYFISGPQFVFQNGKTIPREAWDAQCRELLAARIAAARANATA